MNSKQHFLRSADMQWYVWMVDVSEEGRGFSKYLGGRHTGDASRGFGDDDVINGTGASLWPCLPTLPQDKASKPDHGWFEAPTCRRY